MKQELPQGPSFPIETLSERSGRLPRHGEDFWRQAISDWERSGLSLSMFCQQNGLAKATFFKWRKVLRERGPLPAPSQLNAVGGFLQIAATASAPALRRPSPASEHLGIAAARVDDCLSVSLGGLDIKLTGQYAERIMRILTQRLGAGTFR